MEESMINDKIAIHKATLGGVVLSWDNILKSIKLFLKKRLR